MSESESESELTSEARSASRQVIARRTAEVAGAKVSYLEAGPRDGVPLVFFHGMPASAELWRDVLGEVAGAAGAAKVGYRALAPDLPGYGGTRLPRDGDHSLAGAADLLAAWIEAEVSPASETPVWLVGHDLGGAAAQILVGRRPDLIGRLTLGDTVVEDGWPVAPVRLFRGVASLGLYPVLAAAGLIPNPYARYELAKGFARPERLGDEAARRVFWDTKVTEPEGRAAFARHLAALDPEQTVEAARRLHRFQGPCLLLWGEKDRFLPVHRDGEGLRRLLPGSDLEILPDAGHFAPLERPRAWAGELLAWGERVRTAG